MKFKEFLDIVGLAERFKDLGEVPLDVLLYGVRQQSFPYPETKLDTSSQAELIFILSELEDTKDISIQLIMGSGIINFYIYNKYKQIANTRLFTH